MQLKRYVELSSGRVEVWSPDMVRDIVRAPPGTLGVVFKIVSGLLNMEHKDDVNGIFDMVNKTILAEVKTKESAPAPATAQPDAEHETNVIERVLDAMKHIDTQDCTVPINIMELSDQPSKMFDPKHATGDTKIILDYISKCGVKFEILPSGVVKIFKPEGTEEPVSQTVEDDGSGVGLEPPRKKKSKTAEPKKRVMETEVGLDD